jgi:hypothetical protein
LSVRIGYSTTGLIAKQTEESWLLGLKLEILSFGTHYESEAERLMDPNCINKVENMRCESRLILKLDIEKFSGLEALTKACAKKYKKYYTTSCIVLAPLLSD